MKIRKGFVSNSSSSSFIVAFPKGFVPTAENVKSVLFADRGEQIDCYDYSASTADAARVIAKEMSEQAPNEVEKLKEAISGHNRIRYEDFEVRLPDGKIKWDWEAYQKAADAADAVLLAEFQKGVGDCDLYTFEFSDNDGSFYCSLEHGGTFDAVEHLCISRH